MDEWAWVTALTLLVSSCSTAHLLTSVHAAHRSGCGDVALVTNCQTSQALKYTFLSGTRPDCLPWFCNSCNDASSKEWGGRGGVELSSALPTVTFSEEICKTGLDWHFQSNTFSDPSLPPGHTLIHPYPYNIYYHPSCLRPCGSCWAQRDRVCGFLVNARSQIYKLRANAAPHHVTHLKLCVGVWGRSRGPV